jgi:preprotein translocase subunit SecG
MHYIYILLCFAQFLTAVGLIVVVTMQESKTDGLTGQIGTTATSSFKGKAGREEHLNLLTRNIAIAFFLISVLVAIGTKRW